MGLHWRAGGMAWVMRSAGLVNGRAISYGGFQMEHFAKAEFIDFF